MRTHQLKTDSTASSKAGLLESQSKFVQKTGKKLPKNNENLYSDFNYVKSAKSLHRQAIARGAKRSSSSSNDK